MVFCFQSFEITKNTGGLEMENWVHQNRLPLEGNYEDCTFFIL